MGLIRKTGYLQIVYLKVLKEDVLKDNIVFK
jgi:hypothetical protein